MNAGNWVDLLIIGIVGLSVLTGLMRGFFKELIALGAWILAIWLGLTYTSVFSTHLQPYIPDSTLRTAVGFIIILFSCLLLGALINALLGFILRHSGLSGADRIMGMGFGFIRGVLIVSLGMVIAGMTGVDLKPYRENSRLYAYFDPVVSKIGVYVQPLITRAMNGGKKEKEKTPKPK